MSRIVLIDFYATWCNPCKMQDVIIQELKMKLGNKVEFKKINVDGDHELANRYQIQAVPTIIIENEGIIVKRFFGITSSEELEKGVNDAISQGEGGKEGKLIKIVMEYDDGTKKYIDGDDVGKWQRAINSAIVNSHIHGSDVQNSLKDITWKKLQEKKI